MSSSAVLREVVTVTREEEKKKLMQRLKRIEGQIRGIQRMIDEDQYCVDILIQVAAARAALDKVGLGLFEGHTRHCVVEAVQEERSEEAIEELMGVIMRFIK